MSEEKFILTETQISKYAKILDGAINWGKILGKVKVLFLFSIDLGDIAERNDKKGWEKLLKLLNSLYQKGKISDSLASLIKNIFTEIEESDESGLIDVIASVIAGRINFMDDDAKEETLIKSALIMLSTLNADFLDELNQEFTELEEKADTQDVQ